MCTACLRPVTFLRYKLLFFPFRELANLVFDGGINTVRAPGASWRSSECRAVQPEDFAARALRRRCCFWVLGAAAWALQGADRPHLPLCRHTACNGLEAHATLQQFQAERLNAECDLK